jgi:hypothetical protein
MGLLLPPPPLLLLLLLVLLGLCALLTSSGSGSRLAVRAGALDCGGLHRGRYRGLAKRDRRAGARRHSTIIATPDPAQCEARVARRYSRSHALTTREPQPEASPFEFSEGSNT